MIFAQIFDMVNVGIVILDLDFRVQMWNRWMETHSQITAKQIVGQALFDFFPSLNTPWFNRNCKSVMTFGNFAFFSQKLHGYLFPFKAVNTLGTDVEYMQQSGTIGPLRDDRQKISHIFIMVQDVTEVAAYEAKLVALSTRDGLTGVFNRRYLEVRLKEEFDRFKRYGRPFSIILQDIDHFKRINDTHGHQCGDYVLKEFAGLNVATIRSVDIFARFGGEEFCLMLPETPQAAAKKLAEHLRRKVAQTVFTFKEEDINITISQGISELNQQVKSIDALLKNADDALYEAKKSGRNRVVTME